MITNFQIHVDASGIAHLLFDIPNEKINKLSPPILEELEAILEKAAKNPQIRVLIFQSGKEDLFIAGADIRSFQPAFQKPELIENILKTGHRVFLKIENLPFPTIALIHGGCFGGGLELALACTYRIVTDHPKTVLALPEVTLGIFPGWGGTQRLPRLIGLPNALEMILTGKNIKAPRAYKMHLADAIIPWEFKDQKAEAFASYILTPAGQKKILQKRERKDLQHYLLEQNPLGRYFIFQKAEKELLKKTKGYYPAPIAALNVIKETYALPLQTGLNKEISAFIQGVSHNTFSNATRLIPLFFTQEELKKDPGTTVNGITPQKIQSTGILGAGTMGSGIAMLLTYHDIPTRIKDVNWDALGKGYAAVKAYFNKLTKDKRLKPGEANNKFDRLSGSVDYSGFQNVDLVIEAAVENLELKHQIIKELENVISSQAIIASNTSSLTIAEMAREMKHPERFVGMHFFNPANRMPLVEVVPGEKTSPEAIATAVDFCKKIGKTPIVVGDCHGFLVNRIFVLGANELLYLLEEGTSMDLVVKMMLHFGMPMDPFLLADEVGNDVSYKVTKVFEKSYGPRMKAPNLVEKMYEHKLFGKKVGKGFYLYQGNDKKPNPEIQNILLQTSHPTPTEIEMHDRVFFTMINEAARCLEEKVINKPQYLDMALIMGIGFPPFKGGLLRYADDIGISHIVDRLNTFKQKCGNRFEPCALLNEMQRSNKKFY